MKRHKKGDYENEVQGHMVGNISETDTDFGLRFTAYNKKGLYQPRWSRSTNRYTGYYNTEKNLLSNRPRLKDK